MVRLKDHYPSPKESKMDKFVKYAEMTAGQRRIAEQSFGAGWTDADYGRPHLTYPEADSIRSVFYSAGYRDRLKSRPPVTA
jgi:hypothetical protein